MRERLQKEFRDRKEKIGLNADLCKHLFPLLNARINNLGIRSFFVHTIFQYVREQAVKEEIKLLPYQEVWFDTKLPFVAETMIAVQYYENVILDGKGGLLKRAPENPDGTYNRTKLHDRLIGGHYVKDSLYDYIDECIFDPQDYERIRMTQKAVRRIFQYVDLGQTVQMEYGTFENFLTNYKDQVKITPDVDAFIKKDIIDYCWKIIQEQGITEDQKVFTSNYLRRIYLTSGALYGVLVELVMDLVGYHRRERENIVHFALYFGIVGQIVNDINDFTPPEANIFTVSKRPEDAFSDLLNDNITLPLIFYFSAQSGTDTIQDLQHLSTSPSILLEKLAPALQPTRAMADLLGKHTEAFLRADNIWCTILRDMTSITKVESNQFYKAIHQCTKPGTAQVDTTPLQEAPVKKSHKGSHLSEYYTEMNTESAPSKENRVKSPETLFHALGVKDTVSKSYIRRDRKFSNRPICC